MKRRTESGTKLGCPVSRVGGQKKLIITDVPQWGLGGKRFPLKHIHRGTTDEPTQRTRKVILVLRDAAANADVHRARLHHGEELLVKKPLCLLRPGRMLTTKSDSRNTRSRSASPCTRRTPYSSTSFVGADRFTPVTSIPKALRSLALACPMSP
ncbi:hypothetical protein C3747_130g89 [Trypanosoma cruzi]|uniref:Uncharacterized protein n=1 Tax=Trypanosoma cruzi TaxID=5693 RepID=A0A2V2WD27_TRYCR|nr:hypothetical protein C3747_130g89 [Trypanosoma cruzi]